MTRFVVALVLAAAAALAGCSAGDPPPAGPAPTRTGPPPTLSPATTVASNLPRLIGRDGDFVMFEVSAQQRELVARNGVRVLIRQGLSKQGVRFGITADPSQSRHVVLVNPGVSGLSARQILDRMLQG